MAREAGSADRVTLKIPRPLYLKLRQVIEGTGFRSVNEFVVHVLQRFFNKGREEATRIMLMVHHKGVGVCGVYAYEVAETKVNQVMDLARRHEHPLQCIMEKE